MSSLKLVLILSLLLVFTIITVQNAEVIRVEFLVWEVSMSRIVLLLLSLFTGFVLGYLFSTGRGLRKKVEAMKNA